PRLRATRHVRVVRPVARAVVPVGRSLVRVRRWVVAVVREDGREPKPEAAVEVVPLEPVPLEVVAFEAMVHSGSARMTAPEAVTARARGLNRRIDRKRYRQCGEHNECRRLRTCKLGHAMPRFLLPTTMGRLQRGGRFTPGQVGWTGCIPWRRADRQSGLVPWLLCGGTRCVGAAAAVTGGVSVSRARAAPDTPHRWSRREPREAGSAGWRRRTRSTLRTRHPR